MTEAQKRAAALTPRQAQMLRGIAALPEGKRYGGNFVVADSLRKLSCLRPIFQDCDDGDPTQSAFVEQVRIELSIRASEGRL